MGGRENFSVTEEHINRLTCGEEASTDQPAPYSNQERPQGIYIDTLYTLYIHCIWQVVTYRRSTSVPLCFTFHVIWYILYNPQLHILYISSIIIYYQQPTESWSAITISFSFILVIPLSTTLSLIHLLLFLCSVHVHVETWIQYECLQTGCSELGSARRHSSRHWYWPGSLL